MCGTLSGSWLVAVLCQFVMRAGDGWNWLRIMFSGGLCISSVAPPGFAITELDDWLVR